MTSFPIGAGIIKIDSRKNEPLFRQIYQGLRKSILDGSLAKGSLLPSTRELASQLGLSRMTVVNAYDQLIAEGYLCAKTGKGTFVSLEFPEEKQLVRFRDVANSARDVLKQLPSGTSYLSNNGKRLTLQTDSAPSQLRAPLKPFCPGVPALDEFPVPAWSKICRYYWKNLSPADISYGPSNGYGPLRKSVCQYVQTFRGVQCEADQVMIVNGTQQALDVTARLLLDSGDDVLFENPGYRSGRDAIIAAGGNIIPMPIDRNGAIVGEGIRKSPKAKMAYVTPSHQYPMGVTMSIERRMELIAWAQSNRSVIIEDDYDSEYRYAQHPIPSLQGLDHSARTVYIGSFSKVLFPALGMGYVVVPRPLITAYETALTTISRPPSMLDQMIVADFINEGHFERHLRRMRKIHQQRRTALVESIESYLPDKLEIIGADAGLHCTARILTSHRDKSLAEKIEANGIIMRHLSAYDFKESKTGKTDSRSSGKPENNGLIFGFACSTPAQIKSSIRKIAKLY